MSDETKRRLRLSGAGKQTSSQSRSEQIRDRRSKTVQGLRQTGRSQRRKITPTEPPPVMMRGSMARPLQSGRSPYKTRRRFDVALNSLGSEMRLPAIPVFQTGWRIISFLLVGFLLFVLYQFWSSPRFLVEEAEISGLQRLSSSDVNAVLDLNRATIFTIDPGALQARLEETFPEFSAVSVQVALPETVAISVTERVPVLLWRSERRTNLIDADGIAFPLRNEAGIEAYPVVDAEGDPPALYTAPEEPVEGQDPLAELADNPLSPMLGLPGQARQFLSKEMVSAILLLSSQTPEGSPVVYDPAHGLGWQDSQGWKVYFGNLNEMEQKLVIYQALVQHVTSNGLTPALISVEYVHHPYYRLEP